MIGGDGIGPTISAVAQNVLEYILKDEVSHGRWSSGLSRG